MNPRPLASARLFATVTTAAVTLTAATATIANASSAPAQPTLTSTWSERSYSPTTSTDVVRDVVTSGPLTTSQVGQTISVRLTQSGGSLDCASPTLSTTDGVSLTGRAATASCSPTRFSGAVHVTSRMVGKRLQLSTFAQPAKSSNSVMATAVITPQASPHAASNLTAVATRPATKPSTIGAPSAAAGAGLDHLDFNEDFTSASSIDSTASGAMGHSFYPTLPWSHDTVAKSTVHDSILTLDQTTEDYNMALLSKDPLTGNGRSWSHGYFEARMKFDPSKGSSAQGWPSLWLMSSNHLGSYGDVGNYGELDVFEAYHETGQAFNGNFYGTVHQWHNNSGQSSAGNNIASLGSVDWSTWHTYGLLWQAGHATWYFDGRPVLTQTWGASALPSPNYYSLATGTFNAVDSAGPMTLMLGTGKGWDLNVDYVRVWEH